MNFLDPVALAIICIAVVVTVFKGGSFSDFLNFFVDYENWRREIAFDIFAFALIAFGIVVVFCVVMNPEILQHPIAR